MRRLSALPLLVVFTACGSSLPATGETRTSGQSALMDKTFAGANKCSPKNHDRPFVIEWDATDMSSFEARAASDVVFVKYEGCELQVLDRCGAGPVRGGLGAYGAVEWTSGSVEKIDISNEGELYTKLPLGAATLGGRAQAGERFHMEYFVSGTRKATREAVYRAELDKNAGCRGATHFVYGYNLGAFALGSQKSARAEAGGTVWGIGAGGNLKSLDSAEKKGGVLTACTGESAKETKSCTVPVRLTLREVSAGKDPEIAAAQAPDTAESLNLAGKIDVKLDQDAKAKARYDAALERFRAGDGKGCLEQLDARDQLDRNAANLSTNPRSPTATYRAWCVMLNGQCDAGKAQFRRALQATLSARDATPELVDRFVEQQAASLCRGAQLSPRDQLLRASATLQRGGNTKEDPRVCASAYADVKRLRGAVKPNGDDDYAVSSALQLGSSFASTCLAKAGDCRGAFEAYKDGMAGDPGAPTDDATLRTWFALRTTACKDFGGASASAPASAAPAAVAPTVLSAALTSAPSAPTPRDELLAAARELRQGSATDSAACSRSYASVQRLGKTVKPNDESDVETKAATNKTTMRESFMACLVRTGDCPKAKKAWQGANAKKKSGFERQFPACKK